MARPALLALAAIALLGCRPAADASSGPAGSPGDSVAGTEVPGSSGTRSRSPVAELVSTGALARSLVAVTATSATEAAPCERVCGSLGDCLLADDGYTASVAGRLELQCLDMCVHAPDDSAAKRSFLACGGQECAGLEVCAENNWAALGANYVRAESAPVADSGDGCETACHWFYSCISFSQPPDRAPVDSEQDMQRTCVQMCQEPSEADLILQIRSCVTQNCTDQDAFINCWASVVSTY